MSSTSYGTPTKGSAKGIRKICKAGLVGEAAVRDLFHLELLTGAFGYTETGAHSFKLQEETVTEVMLGSMCGTFGEVVEVFMFDHAVETATGADWIWELDYGDEGRFLALVQAKKSQESWDGSTSWYVNVKQSQRKVLDQTASWLKIPALYCLYVPESPSSCTALAANPSFVHFVSAGQVTVEDKEEKRFRRKDLTKIETLMCLCCSTTKPADAAAKLGVDLADFPQRSFHDVMGIVADASADTPGRSRIKFAVRMKMKRHSRRGQEVIER